MKQAVFKVMLSEFIKIATIPFRFIPIKRNRILFTGLTGGRNFDYSCNPKYVYEYLREHYSGEFQYVWAVSDKKKYTFLEKEGVKLVKHFSFFSLPMLLTAKIIVTNGSYAPWFPFRKRQYVINTWHGGGAYKKVENERPDANWATRKRAEFCAKNIDLFLASCRVQEEQMIKTTYQYKGEVLRVGTPRNDKLVNGNTNDMAEKVRTEYNIPANGRIVLYAPTYRHTGIPVIMDSDYLLGQLNKMQWTGVVNSQETIVDKKETVKWFFMCRYHRYQDESMDISVTGNHIIDVVDYPDMQELLCAADVLITDYSSCVWDYAFLKRPCFLFVPDKEEYIANTGFYVGMNEWPFAQAKSMDELIQNMAEYDDASAKIRIAEHIKKLGSYESGSCCHFVAEKICSVKGK